MLTLSGTLSSAFRSTFCARIFAVFSVPFWVREMLATCG